MLLYTMTAMITTQPTMFTSLSRARVRDSADVVMKTSIAFYFLHTDMGGVLMRCPQLHSLIQRIDGGLLSRQRRLAKH